jgi:hypothetical protein
VYIVHNLLLFIDVCLVMCMSVVCVYDVILKCIITQLCVLLIAHRRFQSVGRGSSLGQLSKTSIGVSIQVKIESV